MSVGNYRSEDVQVIVGTRRLRGLAPGTFVRVARDADTFSKVVGSDGEVSRAKSADKSGVIELTLLGTSEDNAYLQGLHNTDEQTGTGIIPAKVIDKSGSYIATSTESWILKPAEKEFSNENTNRQWTIVSASLEEVGGGN